MSYLDNPAGRLLALFQAARRTDQTAAATKGWSEVFSIEQTDTVQFMKRVAQMFELASETKRLINTLPDEDPDVLLEHFPEVERTLQNFQVVLQRNMQQFLENLGPKSGEHSLKLCSSRLHRRMAEPDIEEETARWLVIELDTLVELVIDADDLGSEVQDWIIRRLNEVRDVLLNLRIHGSLDLEAAKDRLLGGVTGKTSRIAAVRDSKICKSFVTFLVAIDLAVNFGANWRQLTSGEPPKPSPIVIEIENFTGVQAELPALPPASSPPDEP